MDLTGTKVLALSILFLGSLFLGVLSIWVGPLIGRDNRRARVIVSVLLCFGGGVLFSTCFTHIMPEALESFNSYENLEEKPVGEITLCMGFFLIYLVEELVHFFSDSHVHSHPNTNSARVHRALSVSSQSCSVTHDDRQQRDSDHKPSSYDTFERGKATTNGDRVVPIKSDRSSSMTSTLYEPFCSPTSIRDFVTVVALSFHAVFEGLAVGLEPDEADVWQLFGAVAAHKFVIAFSFGMELYQSGLRRSLHVLYIFTFSAMSALGIGIGIAISEEQSDTKAYILTTASLQALSAGTLLYVALFEIMARERSKTDVNGMLQLTAILTGFGIMMMIDLLAPHHHEHEEHEDEESTTTESGTAALLSSAGKMALRALTGQSNLGGKY